MVSKNANMTRQRKGHSSDPGWKKECTSSSSTGSKDSSPSPTGSRGLLAHWMTLVGGICLLVATYIGYLGYLETRVNTPFDEHKIILKSGLEVPEKFWGTYRPGLYFGLRTREPQSLLMGLMWYSPLRLRPGGDGIRHWCSQADDLEKYGWIKHDGSSIGEQELHDGPWLIKTTYLRGQTVGKGGDWSARISVSPKKNAANLSDDIISLIWYTTSEGVKEAELKPSQASQGVTGLKGFTPTLGNFKLSILPNKGQILHESYLNTISLGSHLLRETIVSSLRLVRDQKTSRQWIALAGDITDKQNEWSANLVATQVTIKVPCELDIMFESANAATIRDGQLAGDAFTQLLKQRRETFDAKFADIFKLKEKGYNRTAIQFAQAAFSNLIGGIGYFYGSSRVQSQHTREPVPYWKAPLYTAVPSRSHFPRGFLWDEGFHCLVLARWDRNMVLDIMGHWFQLMNVEGWIPREQILGTEAQARVPEQFVTQRNSNANPPTFFLTLLQLLGEDPEELDPLSDEYNILNRMFPRLQAWYNWFNTTQAGELPTSYRWRGRTADDPSELNPKTLTSGLDDYPRSSHPSTSERHVDLRCWMLLGAKVLSSLSLALGKLSAHLRYSSAAAALSDTSTLVKLHWSAKTETFSDYGLHTDSVTLRRLAPPPGARSPSPTPPMARVVLHPPELRLVDSSYGYVSLFPLLLKVLPSDSYYLGKMLDLLDNPDLLWTDYGLRSLSKSSPMYMKRNTEHDPPYWRGQVWININYLALAALHHYSHDGGPHAVKALDLYKRLRHNVVENIMKEYLRSGYIWEQYSDKTGYGSGCRPFTGWTSLVVLIMSETY